MALVTTMAALRAAPAAPELQSARTTYLRGERAEMVLRCPPEQRRGLKLVLRALDTRGSWPLKCDEDGKAQIDTAQYRVGDYEVSASKGKEVLCRLALYVRPARRPEMWFGNFTGRHPRVGGNPYEELRSLGMNAAYSYSMHPDQSLRCGVYLVHHGNALRKVGKDLPAEQKQKLLKVYKNCKGDTKVSAMACMRNPEVIRLASDGAAAELKDLAGYPGFLGIGLDDEITQRGYDWNDTGGVMCYCESCKRLWTEKVGQEPPTPPCLQPGTIIPDDDPYLRYMLEWTGWGDYYGPAEADYNRALAEKVHALRKDLIVFQTPGASFGELDVVHPEIYDYWFSSPVTGALSTMSLTRALQREAYGAAKPIWPLIGWFQRTPAPAWTGAYIETQSKMCLAEGADALWLTLMFWYDSRGKHKPTMLQGAEHIAPSVRAVGDLLERFGPTLKRVTPVRYPVAVLHSATTEGYQRIIDPETIARAKAEGSWMEVAWEHGQATGMGFAALLRAGMPAEFITEEDVLAGRLEHYGALVLLDHKYARKSVADRIGQYAAKGGLVFADKSSLIRPKEAKALPFDASQFTRMINLGLRTARRGGQQLEIVHERTTGLEREWALLSRKFLARSPLPAELLTVSSDNMEVITRMGRCGEADYVFVLSADVLREQSATVSARTRGRFAYELFAGDTPALAAPNGELRLRATLPPGGWRVYVVTPDPLGPIALDARADGKAVSVQVQVRNSKGGVVDGAFPVHVEVFDPKGKPLPYGGYFATDAGVLEYRFAAALNDPVGSWKVRATHLATGHTAEAEVKVSK